jgi:phosphate transport system protein
MQGDEIARLLDDIEDKVLTLGDQVEGMLIRSAELLERPELEGQEWLGEEGRRLRDLRLAIEMRGLALTAARQPGNSEGRSPVVLMEIASDLELIGEHARQIGRADYAVLDRHFGKSLQSIHHLAEVVRHMLHQAVWAAAHRDAVAAQAVLARATETAPLYEAVQQELRLLMHHQPRFTDQAVHLAHSVNQLGLATEKVLSICEWAVYEVQGGTHSASNV